MSETFLGILVILAIVGVLIFDLGFLQRRDEPPSMRSAIGWSIFWIAFALLFNVAIYFFVGSREAIEFLSGYLVEKSLSVDNLFVFLMIFSYFQVPVRFQHKVLFWGIVGAVVFRGVLIAGGLALIQQYHWLTYVLGIFLIITGLKTAKGTNDDLDLEDKWILKALRRFLPLTTSYRDNKFLVQENNRWCFTPLFVVLTMIETTDILFALDSIPAILAITQDPFVLYTSNLFAILGLRALYFVLAGLMEKLHFLGQGVSLILIFVGSKMLVAPLYDVTEVQTLFVIGTILVLVTVGSLLFPLPPKAEKSGEPPQSAP